MLSPVIVVVTDGLFGFRSITEPFLPYPVIVIPLTLEVFLGLTSKPIVPSAFPVSNVYVLTSPREGTSVNDTSGP